MIRKLALLSAIVAVIALAAVWASPRDSNASTWAPNFAPGDFYTLAPTATGANADTIAQFNVNAPSTNFSALFGRAITFGDGDVVTGADAAVPNGAYMGRLSSVAILGLANEGCNSVVPVTFDFVDSRTDMTPRPFTNGGAMTVGGGGLPAAADDALTDFVYAHGLDPLGLKQNTDVAGLGTAPEGTIRAGVNEIDIEGEQMLVVGLDAGTNTYRVIRGWNGTATAAHAAGAAVTRVPVIYPNGPGTNLLANLGEDDGDLDNNGVAEEAAGPPGGPQTNGNQVSDGADATSSFIRDSLDPNSNADDGGYVQAHARYTGVAFVASSLIVILQFALMAPGALTVFPNLDWAAATWGYSSTTFLNDPLAPPSDSAITDFCNFSSNTNLYGVTHDNACTDTLAAPPGACTGAGAGFTLRLAVDGGGPVAGGGPACPAPPVTAPNECGSIRSTNPAAVQRVRYYQYSVAQRDYDSDGHENALDVCAYIPNATWNPRDFNGSSGSDGDSDGLPTACDPADLVFDNDQDDDSNPNNTGWFNRLDNCPTVPNTAAVGANPDGGGGLDPNSFQYDFDVPAGVVVPDGGPSSDSIGPACDIAGNSCGGCPTLTPTGANGHYHAAYATATICVGVGTPAEQSQCSATTDDDGDGVVNSQDTCRAGANAPVVFTGASGADTLAAPAAAGAGAITVVDATGFTNGSPIVISSPTETIRHITNIVGTTLSVTPTLSSAHAAGAAVAQVAYAQTSRDLNNSGAADTGDIALLTGAFGKSGGNPALPGGFQARYDINGGVPTNAIDTADIAQMTAVFGRACGPA